MIFWDVKSPDRPKFWEIQMTKDTRESYAGSFDRIHILSACEIYLNCIKNFTFFLKI